MDLASVAEAVRAVADQERFHLAAIAKRTRQPDGQDHWPPGGLFLPRPMLIAQLEVAAARLG